MKPQPKGHGFTLEKMWPDHLIYSAVTATKLSLWCVIQKRRRTRTRRNAVFFF